MTLTLTGGRRPPYLEGMGKAKMGKAAKRVAKREPLAARPRDDLDVDALTDEISGRFSKSLERLAK